MIDKLTGREKILWVTVADKVNELIEILNEDERKELMEMLNEGKNQKVKDSK